MFKSLKPYVLYFERLSIACKYFGCTCEEDKDFQWNFSSLPVELFETFSESLWDFLEPFLLQKSGLTWIYLSFVTLFVTLEKPLYKGFSDGCDK